MINLYMTSEIIICSNLQLIKVQTKPTVIFLDFKNDFADRVELRKIPFLIGLKI